MKMKPSKIERTEIQVIANICNTLILMMDDPQCTPRFKELLRPASRLLGDIAEAHGMERRDASTIITKGVVHEWPTTSRERIKAIR